MGEVFISYSHRDGEYAHRLAADLRSQGLDVWIDDRIDYGDQWPRVIQDNLAACQVFLVVMSTNALNSMWVQNEVSYAQANGKSIFPLLLEGKVWLSLASMQFADVRDGSMPPARFSQRVRSALGRAAQPEARKEALPEPKRRKSRAWGFVAGLVLLAAVAVGAWLLWPHAEDGAGTGPTVGPTEPTAHPSEPVATEETPTDPAVTEPPAPEEFTSGNFHLQVGDTRDYAFGMVVEGGGDVIDVNERIVALEQDSNALIEIYRVERSESVVGLDCHVEPPVWGQTLWYIRDETRIFTACNEQEKAEIVDALVRERLMFGATPEPPLLTPAYVFPITLDATWSEWADVPPGDSAMYVWMVDSHMEQKKTYGGDFQDCYTVTLRTNSDITTREICNGFGLVGWSYLHFGTQENYAGQLKSYEFGQ